MRSRSSGKTVQIISRAVETGGVIIVHSEASRDHILHTAELMRVKAPKVIVVKDVPKRELRKPVTLAGVIVDL